MNVQEHLPASEISSAAALVPQAIADRSYLFPVIKQQDFVVTIDTSSCPPNILLVGSVVSLRSELQDTRRGVVYKLDNGRAELILAGDQPVKCLDAKLFEWWLSKASLSVGYL